MQVEVAPFGLVMPDASREVMSDLCAVMLQETGGTRRCLIGFPKQYFAYIVTAIHEVLTHDTKHALHGAMVRLLQNSGIAIERLIIRKPSEVYTGTLVLTQNGTSREEPMPLADAIPMALHARCPIRMEDDDLAVSEIRFSAVADHFIIVEHMADIPIVQAEWRAMHGTHTLN